MNKLEIGKRNEFSVWSRLLKFGIDVYPALVDDKGIDGIAGHDGKYYEIQIKSGKSWNTPRGISYEICSNHPNRIFVIYNYGEDEIIYLTGDDILKEPEWSKYINYNISQLKWNKALLKKYSGRGMGELVEYLKTGKKKRISKKSGDRKTINN